MRRAGIFNDTSVSGHYGCTAVMGTLVDGLASRGVAPAWLWPVATPWQGREAWMRRQGPDLIVVNGEGTIHHSAERQRTRDLLDVARRDWGVPVHLVNASVTALDAPALEAMARFDTVHVRESESAAYLAEHGIAATLVPDLSLGLPAPAPRARSGIVVTDSVIGETAGALRGFAAGQGARFERMKPRFRKLARLRHSIEEMRVRRHWRARSDAGAFAARLAGADLVVTGRFHSVLLSILTDTPFAAIPSNTRKIEAVLGDALSGEARMIEAGALSDPEALAARMTPLTQGERAALAAYRAMAADARAAMFDRLAG